jgi:pre-rRNA-processing protein TSR4
VFVEEEPRECISDKTETKLLQKYKQEMQSMKGEKWAKEGYEADKDRIFFKFQRRMKRSPEQCLRYCFDGEPLWISEDVPESIPVCTKCGAKRVFELQLMPTLLYLHDGLKLQTTKIAAESNTQILVGSGVEYGVVSLFSCSKSCHSSDSSYYKEFIFVQGAV